MNTVSTAGVVDTIPLPHRQIHTGRLSELADASS